MSTPPTQQVTVTALEPFPTITAGDDLAHAITTTLAAQNFPLVEDDVLVVASKIVSLSEHRSVDLDEVTPTTRAHELSQATGKPPEIIQVILDESVDYHLATPTGPIIALHRLGYELTSSGVDRDRTTRQAWLLPANPDASARALRDTLTAATGVRLAVILADSDGRPDRHGSTVIALGAAGIHPLRTTEHAEKTHHETLTDLAAGAAGITLGQRGRGAPVTVLRGLHYHHSDAGIGSILHHGQPR
ncbi:coenzyme F420-0:L-glutamate ligase [Actinopolyspora mortivallis]|uniref:Coenzyme F420:L-glutamate ligase-like domain-containing protein n=1 Tax=Actinopolyspora mortivallis TaxID=33906 RepID=A0A2T0GZH3_ACTMO|nr:coenzyme F420-0:L-glutamate ligase [Actinopolyspora mortivallis]PRW64504.1 hypothetical protein CEP50_03850 [Actinopolyspora mortivallis]